MCEVINDPRISIPSPPPFSNAQANQETTNKQHSVRTPIHKLELSQLPHFSMSGSELLMHFHTTSAPSLFTYICRACIHIYVKEVSLGLCSRRQVRPTPSRSHQQCWSHNYRQRVTRQTIIPPNQPDFRMTASFQVKAENPSRALNYYETQS